MNTKEYRHQLFSKWWLTSMVFKVLTWLSKSYVIKHKNLDVPCSPRVFIPLLNRLALTRRSRGDLGLISYVKDLRVCYLNYLSGETDKVSRIKTTKRGLPRVLRFLDNEVTSVINLRLLTTILFMTRTLRSQASSDVESIVTPAVRGADFRTHFAKAFWRALGSRPSQRVPRALRWRQYHMSTKTGPTGHQALGSSLIDVYNLPDSLVNSISTVGGDGLKQRLSALRQEEVQNVLGGFFPIRSENESKTIRRIVHFPDLEGKTRVVAILDYWSQTALRPLHQWLFRNLKRIPQDCTFDQGSFVHKVKDWDYFVSVDLTAATDRFPIRVIADVLKARLPSDYVDSWVDILVGYAFETQSGELVKYQAGNPMGAYSSWATFAIANHYMVYHCCRELKIEWSTAKYCLLGDDIIFGDKDLAESYILAVQSLGVEINDLKTHRSPQLGEFAKRWIYQGQEITPFPINSLREIKSRWDLLIPTLHSECERGWFSPETVPLVTELYFKIVRPMSSKWRQRNYSLWVLAGLIMKIMREPTSVTDESLWDFWSKRGAKTPSSFPDKQAIMSVLQEVSKELFLESHPSYRQGDFELGLHAYNAVIYLSSEENAITLLTHGLEFHWIPILNVHGQVEEKFLEFHKQMINIDTLGEDWDITLRSMTLPVSDKVYSLSRQDLRAISAASIGRKVLERLEVMGYTSCFQELFSQRRNVDPE